jgi:hypothetical protein
MDKVIIWKKPDGELAFTRCLADHANADPHGHAADLSQSVEHAGYQFLAVIDVDAMPDRGNPYHNAPAAAWSSAWHWNGSDVAVSMPKARELHRNRLREHRKGHLLKLDVEYQKADEAGDAAAKTAIAQKKQQLRDVTAHPSIEAAQTVHELARVWPFDTPPPAAPLPAAPVFPPLAAEGPIMPLPEQPVRRRIWSMEHLLQRATPLEPPKGELPAATEPPAPPMPAPPLDDTMRRRAAKEAVRRAVSDVSQSSADLQMRYELALQARNGNVQCLEMFEEEARAANVSIQELAERIIVDRRARERRMMQVHAIQARALAELDQAAGDEIGTVEQTAVEKIRGT